MIRITLFFLRHLYCIMLMLVRLPANTSFDLSWCELTACLSKKHCFYVSKKGKLNTENNA